MGGLHLEGHLFVLFCAERVELSRHRKPPNNLTGDGRIVLRGASWVCGPRINRRDSIVYVGRVWVYVGRVGGDAVNLDGGVRIILRKVTDS